MDTESSSKVFDQTHSWHVQDGVIYFSVVSDGTTGPAWIERLEHKGFLLSNYAKSVLGSDNFEPTLNIPTKIILLKGMLFEDHSRITKKINTEANQRNLGKPNAEVACLIREKFTDDEIEAMGLFWIVTMHEPIKDFLGDPCLLTSGRSRPGHWFRAYCARPGNWWHQDCGFVFTVS